MKTKVRTIDNKILDLWPVHLFFKLSNLRPLIRVNTPYKGYEHFFKINSFKSCLNELLFKKCFIHCIKLFFFSVEAFCPERGCMIECTQPKYNLFGGKLRPKFHNAYKCYETFGTLVQAKMLQLRKKIIWYDEWNIFLKIVHLDNFWRNLFWKNVHNPYKGY